MGGMEEAYRGLRADNLSTARYLHFDSSGSEENPLMIRRMLDKFFYEYLQVQWRREAVRRGEIFNPQNFIYHSQYYRVKVPVENSHSQCGTFTMYFLERFMRRMRIGMATPQNINITIAFDCCRFEESDAVMHHLVMYFKIRDMLVEQYGNSNIFLLPNYGGEIRDKKSEESDDKSTQNKSDEDEEEGDSDSDDEGDSDDGYLQFITAFPNLTISEGSRVLPAPTPQASGIGSVQTFQHTVNESQGTGMTGSSTVQLPQLPMSIDGHGQNNHSAPALVVIPNFSLITIPSPPPIATLPPIVTPLPIASPPPITNPSPASTSNQTQTAIPTSFLPFTRRASPQFLHQSTRIQDKKMKTVATGLGKETKNVFVQTIQPIRLDNQRMDSSLHPPSETSVSKSKELGKDEVKERDSLSTSQRMDGIDRTKNHQAFSTSSANVPEEVAGSGLGSDSGSDSLGSENRNENKRENGTGINSVCIPVNKPVNETKNKPESRTVNEPGSRFEIMEGAPQVTPVTSREGLVNSSSAPTLGEDYFIDSTVSNESKKSNKSKEFNESNESSKSNVSNKSNDLENIDWTAPSVSFTSTEIVSATSAVGSEQSEDFGIRRPPTLNVSPPRSSPLSPPRSSPLSPPRSPALSPPRSLPLSPPRSPPLSPPLSPFPYHSADAEEEENDETDRYSTVSIVSIDDMWQDLLDGMVMPPDFDEEQDLAEEKEIKEVKEMRKVEEVVVKKDVAGVESENISEAEIQGAEEFDSFETKPDSFKSESDSFETKLDSFETKTDSPSSETKPDLPSSEAKCAAANTDSVAEIPFLTVAEPDSSAINHNSTEMVNSAAKFKFLSHLSNKVKQKYLKRSRTDSTNTMERKLDLWMHRKRKQMEIHDAISTADDERLKKKKKEEKGLKEDQESKKVNVNANERRKLKRVLAAKIERKYLNRCRKGKKNGLKKSNSIDKEDENKDGSDKNVKNDKSNGNDKNNDDGDDYGGDKKDGDDKNDGQEDKNDGEDNSDKHKKNDEDSNTNHSTLANSAANDANNGTNNGNNDDTNNAPVSNSKASPHELSKLRKRKLSLELELRNQIQNSEQSIPKTQKIGRRASRIVSMGRVISNLFKKRRVDKSDNMTKNPSSSNFKFESDCAEKRKRDGKDAYKGDSYSTSESDSMKKQKSIPKEIVSTRGEEMKRKEKKRKGKESFK